MKGRRVGCDEGVEVFVKGWVGKVGELRVGVDL